MSLVWTAASDAIKTLREIGYPDACFVGGVASSLYGNARTPNDLDILILSTSNDQEFIKRQLVNHNSKFYLVASKVPYATYKVLWYRGNYVDTIKVDILVPGVMEIPNFNPNRIETQGAHPVAPFSIVLLLRLQAWSQHRAALKVHYRIRQHTDKNDLDCLVSIAAAAGVRKDDACLPASFVAMAQIRVREFLTCFPESGTRTGWATMGFDVPAKPKLQKTTYYRRSQTAKR